MSENSVLAVSVEDLKELCLEYLKNGDSALFKASLEKLAMALDIL